MDRAHVWRWFSVLILIMAVDRLLKVLAQMVYAEQAHEFIPGLVSFGFFRNQGIGFGLLLPSTLIISLTTAIVFGLLIWLSLRFRSIEPTGRWAVGLLVSGGLANWYDRIRFGFVIDYFKFAEYGIANLADGVIIFGVLLLLVRWRRQSHQTNS